jgi:hypothetical protein
LSSIQPDGPVEAAGGGLVQELPAHTEKRIIRASAVLAERVRPVVDFILFFTLYSSQPAGFVRNLGSGLVLVRVNSWTFLIIDRPAIH